MVYCSIIVPVYKASATLKRCLDSLVAQTLKGFEIVLVDDGSPDDSGRICDDYAQKHDFIHVIHQPNAGVSSARQKGLDMAHGEYVIHADPDDWVEPDMLKMLYAKAREEDADMVICDFFVNTYKGQEYVKQEPSSLASRVVLKELFIHLHGSCCNKLVRKSCFSRYNVRFPECISFCEDQYVNAALLKNELKVAYCPKAFYHYFRDNGQSLSRAFDQKDIEREKLSEQLFVSLFQDSELLPFVKERKKFSMANRVFHGGKDFVTSRMYREMFSPYKQQILANCSSRTEYFFLFLSLNGFYQISIIFFRAILTLKKKVYCSIMCKP